MDESIVNRATFEETSIMLSCDVKPCQIDRAYHSLQPNQFFCIQEVSWKYGVEVSAKDTYGWPKTPLKVTIPGVIESRADNPVKISPPKLLSDSVQMEVLNPSGMQVKLHLTAKGTLITPRNGTTITSAEAIGYALLDNNQRGLLALGGEQNKALNAMLGTLLQQLPGSNKASIALPASSQPIAALPDSTSLVSTMIGDLITYQMDNPEFELKVSQIRDLAKYLVDRKWLR